jgi:hypothetical protein
MKGRLDQSISVEDRMPENKFQLHAKNIPSVHTVKYLSVAVDRKMAQKVHMDKTTIKDLGMYMRNDSLLTSE